MNSAGFDYKLTIRTPALGETGEVRFSINLAD